MQIKGVELAAFMKEAWPDSGTPQEDDWFWDHDLFDDQPHVDMSYDTDDLGPIQYQGNGEDPTSGEGYDIARLIRKWRKTRDCDILAVAVPREKVAEFKDNLKSLKGSILT